MGSNENRTETLLAGDDGQIRLVMDPRTEEDTIDLGRVFLNMKKREKEAPSVCLGIGSVPDCGHMCRIAVVSAEKRASDGFFSCDAAL